jgi:hypothetical protein
MDEISVAEKLEDFRKEQPGYIGPSFTPIMGYGPHGAIVHYSATEESCAKLEAKSFLLSDTGAHFIEGSTDITRTYALGELTEDTVLTYSIADLLPEGITNISGIEKVNVTIKFPDLKMKTFQVSQILPQNVPAGMHTQILTKELAVTLRGPAALINALTADQIQALVDFSAAELGTDTYKVTFRINGAEGVGAVNNYTVSATVSPAIPAFLG